MVKIQYMVSNLSNLLQILLNFLNHFQIDYDKKVVSENRKENGKVSLRDKHERPVVY